MEQRKIKAKRVKTVSLQQIIRATKTLAVHAERRRLREKIEKLGHQQEDGTIWCNMDKVLKLLR